MLMLIVTAILVMLVSAGLFMYCFYFALPRTIQRQHDDHAKLRVLRGLSSLWLVWPDLFGVFTMGIYLTESVSLVSFFLLLFSFVMGIKETQRVLKTIGIDWHPFNLKTADGKDILGS